MKTKPKYKNKWKEYKANKMFWKEVLVGRNIDKIIFNKKGDLTEFALDSGEVVYLNGNERGFDYPLYLEEGKGRKL